MKIGDEVYVHGYIDEIRQDTVIIRNEGGYFGTAPSEVVDQEETLQNLTKPYKSDLIVKGAGEIKDGLYNIKDGKLFQYKANGGTVRTYPIVSADRPTGHWIENAQEYYETINEKGGGVDENTPYFTDDIACSECLAKFSVIDNETERFDFCPNCGAGMTGGEKE